MTNMNAMASTMTTWQVKPSTGAPEDRSTEFVPVQGGGETTSAETFLVAAYFLMWAALIGFLFATWRRQTRLDSRIAELTRAVERAEKG